MGTARKSSHSGPVADGQVTEGPTGAAATVGDPAAAELDRADWSAARTAFESVLHVQQSAEAHDGLGRALWWLDEVSAAHRERRLAYEAFRRRGDRR